MSTGKRIAATVAVWVADCYVMNFGARLLTALSCATIATVLIWIRRR